MVIATYNRSNLLRMTIESVLAGTYADWEMIVVGDCCTDDTEAVVTSFGDPRISFVNLDRNHGEQSVPNNEGVRRSRGRYIAFLNHDDFWLSDHLDLLVREIESRDADIVFSHANVIEHDGRSTLSGATPTGRYEPYIYVPASTLLVKREVFDDGGLWRTSRESFNVPSQDFIYRAWKRGRRIELVSVLTVLMIPSGWRKNAYATRAEKEHRAFAEQLGSPGFREELLTRIAWSSVSREADVAIVRHLMRGFENVIRRLCLGLRLHPGAVRNALLYRRKGAFVDALRKSRGLPAQQGTRA